MGILWCDVLPREPGWQHLLCLWAPTSPGHPSVSVPGFEVPEPLDITKVSWDTELLMKNMSHHGR